MIKTDKRAPAGSVIPRFQTEISLNLAAVAPPLVPPPVDEARILINVYSTGTWAYINDKLLDSLLSPFKIV